MLRPVELQEAMMAIKKGASVYVKHSKNPDYYLIDLDTAFHNISIYDFSDFVELDFHVRE